MVTLTQPRSSSSRYTPTPSTDDLSGHAHRQLIGYIGLALPILLVLISASRPIDGLGRWELLGSISAYYYTGAVAVFVGLLVALALLLFTYRGYNNQYHSADRVAAIVAGVAALLVAFFPTRAPDMVAPPSWWTQAAGVLHYVSAIVLFTMFAVFSLWLFRKCGKDEKPDASKRRRNRIFLVCGLVIVASMIWAGIAGATDNAIFLPESVALIAFAVSWLVKGYAHRTIAEAARSLAADAKEVK